MDDDQVSKLIATNENLQRQVSERQQAIAQLEQQLEDKEAEVSKTKEQLEQQIIELKQSEEKLKEQIEELTAELVTVEEPSQQQANTEPCDKGSDVIEPLDHEKLKYMSDLAKRLA